MKKLMLGVAGFVVFLILVGVFVGAATDTNNKAVGGKISGNVNLKTYEKIKVGDGLTGAGGMTLDQVTKLIGKEPKDKTEVQSGETKMLTATWDVKASIEFKAIIVSFTNGKASSKSQMGLDK